jgi:hypothetical protein
MITMPATRSIWSEGGASRSAEIASVTAAIATRSIIPMASSASIRLPQDRLQRTPNPSPCRQARRALGSDPQPRSDPSRQSASRRTFHEESCRPPATRSTTPDPTGSHGIPPPRRISNAMTPAPTV